MKGQITKNIASNYVLAAVQMVLGILLVPFLIKKLGAPVFGVAILVESIIAFFETAIASFRIALSRYVTFALAQDKSQDFIEYVSSGRCILFLASLVFLLVGSLITLFFSSIFHVPIGQELQSKFLIGLVILAVVITMPNIIYWSILYAKQRLDLINLSTSSGVILRAMLIFVLFSVLPSQYVSLTTYGIIYFFVRWAQNYFVYRWHKKVLPGVKPQIKFLRWDKVKEMMSFSIHTSLGSISTTIYENMANLFVNIFYGPAANSLYAISLKIPATLKSLFLQATWALTPTFIDLVAKKDTKRIEILFFMYSKMVAAIAIPAILLLSIFARPIISLWVGDSFMLAADLLPIHMVPLLITLSFSATNCLNTANAKVKVPNSVMFVVALVNILLGVVLAKVFNLSLLGFAGATAVCVIISNGLFTPFYACQTSGLDYWRMWRDSFLKPFLLSLLFVSLAVFITKGNWAKASGVIIMGLIFISFSYAVIYIRWIMDPQETQYFYAFLKRFKFLGR